MTLCISHNSMNRIDKVMIQLNTYIQILSNYTTTITPLNVHSIGAMPHSQCIAHKASIGVGIPKCAGSMSKLFTKHIFVWIKYLIIFGHFSSCNGVQPVQRQVISWNQGGAFSVQPLKTNFSEIWVKTLALIHGIAFVNAANLSQHYCVRITQLIHRCCLCHLRSKLQTISC